MSRNESRGGSRKSGRGQYSDIPSRVEFDDDERLSMMSGGTGLSYQSGFTFSSRKSKTGYGNYLEDGTQYDDDDVSI